MFTAMADALLKAAIGNRWNFSNQTVNDIFAVLRERRHYCIPGKYTYTVDYCGNHFKKGLYLGKPTSNIA
jgi:hypothetical protein